MIDRAGLALAVAGAVLVIAFAKKAGSTEYEIWATRASAALLREDQPNSYRIREKDEEPFASLEDCRQVSRSNRIEALLGVKGGWRLRCEPVPVPVERYVIR